MGQLPLTAKIGNVTKKTAGRVAICGVSPVDAERTKFSLLSQDSVTIPLPIDIVEGEIDYFYDNSDEIYFDFTDEAIVELRQKHNLAALLIPEIGELVESKGVYIGVWELKDEGGTVFDLYAAPQDLDLPSSFNEASRYASALLDYHGHNGANLSSSFPQLMNSGKWFIPTYDILKNKIYENRNKGALKGTFNTFGGISSYYWSSTESRLDTSSVRTLHFSSGIETTDSKGFSGQSTRLVRAEQRFSI